MTESNYSETGFQWTNPARTAKLLEYAKQNGGEPTSPATQIAFVIQECDSDMIAKLKAAQAEHEAANPDSTVPSLDLDESMLRIDPETGLSIPRFERPKSDRRPDFSDPVWEAAYNRALGIVEGGEQ